MAEADMAEVQQDLVGRDQELARLRGMLAEAVEGRSAAVVLRGEAGIGKTALLRYAAAQAQSLGFLVVRARGLETESQLAFAALGDLLRPISDLLSRIPPPQAAAVRVALALGPPAAAHRFAVCAGTLSILGEAAEMHPVLVVLEDAQWLDSSSAEALGFAARRIDREGVVMLLAIRDGEPSAFDATGLQELSLTGLTSESGKQLLEYAVGAPIPDEVARSLTAAVGGNPLALLEVPAALSSGQLTGAEPLASPPTVPSVTAAFARLVRALPDASSMALLVSAASDSADLEVITRACRELDVDPNALIAAEDAGLITIDSGVEFRHPLIRAAAYHEAPASRRREAHRALAVIADDAPTRGWHLAAASPGDDENAATALDAAAEEARGRGGHAEAASALERAAGLTPPGPARAQRLLVAARDARNSGNATRALRLLSEALPLDDDPRVRAHLQHLRGAIEMWSGGPRDAHRRLIAEAEIVGPHDTRRAARMLTDAAWAALIAADISNGIETGSRARAVAEGVGGVTSLAADGVLGIALLLGGESARAAPLLSRYHAALAEIESPGRINAMPTPSAQVLTWLERYTEARDVAVAAVERARAQSALGALPYALSELSELDFRTGYWPSASANASEAIRVAEETGQETVLAYALACLARLEAAKGDEVACRAHAIRAIELGEHRIGAAVGFALSAIGLLELGLGRPGAAAETLALLATLTTERDLREPNVVQWEPDFIEACIRMDRKDDAALLLDALESRAQAIGRRWGMAAAARCRGLLAPEPEITSAFETALVLSEDVPSPFERARTLLAYGERLRRSKRRTDARRQLHDALALFEHLGADPWAARARAELAATGEGAAQRVISAADQLTPQELQVALVVAEGATNREAGAKLFLSPKTVEAHLGRIYGKLGVRSRTELARLMTKGAAVGEATA
jgi:DNA-binding CsgD family transcriptional regulator